MQGPEIVWDWYVLYSSILIGAFIESLIQLRELNIIQ
jgi:hypothetical protein